MRKSLSFAVLALTLAAAPAALAQGPTNAAGQCGSAQRADTSREQTFCFEAENVSSSLVGAGGQLRAPLRAGHGATLIRMRAHFVPEMLRSTENL